MSDHQSGGGGALSRIRSAFSFGSPKGSHPPPDSQIISPRARLASLQQQQKDQAAAAQTTATKAAATQKQSSGQLHKTSSMTKLEELQNFDEDNPGEGRRMSLAVTRPELDSASRKSSKPPSRDTDQESGVINTTTEESNDWNRDYSGSEASTGQQKNATPKKNLVNALLRSSNKSSEDKSVDKGNPAAPMPRKSSEASTSKLPIPSELKSSFRGNITSPPGAGAQGIQSPQGGRVSGMKPLGARQDDEPHSVGSTGSTSTASKRPTQGRPPTAAGTALSPNAPNRARPPGQSGSSIQSGLGAASPPMTVNSPGGSRVNSAKGAESSNSEVHILAQVKLALKEHYGDPDKVDDALNLLYSLVADPKAVKTKNAFLQSSGLVNLVIVLRWHPQVESIQKLGCRILSRIIPDDQQAAKVVVDNQGLEHLWYIMGSSQTDPELVALGFELFTRLLFSADVVDRFQKMNVAENVFRVMKEHEQHEIVQQHACAFIGRSLSHMEAQLLLSFKERDGGSHIFSVIHTHKAGSMENSDTEMSTSNAMITSSPASCCSEACLVLRLCLPKVPIEKLEYDRENAIPDLVDLLILYPDQPLLLERTFAVLMRIMYVDPTTMDYFINVDGVKAIEDTISQNMERVGIVDLGMKIMNLLLDIQPKYYREYFLDLSDRRGPEFDSKTYKNHHFEVVAHVLQKYLSNASIARLVATWVIAVIAADESQDEVTSLNGSLPSATIECLRSTNLIPQMINSLYICQYPGQ